MLVLTRKINEIIMIDQGKIEIKVLGMNQDHVKIGINAPPEVSVDRLELFNKKQANKNGNK